MKILLISDTHGELDKVIQVYNKLSGIDMIIHCGDYERDANALKDSLKIPVVSIKGNCDSSTEPHRKTAETPYGNLMVTHGHIEGVNYGTNKLLYLAEENGCIGVCFGHTHVALCENCGEIYLLNPGSLTNPRDGSKGSCIVISCTKDEFHANIVYYDTLCASNDDKKTVRGGFIRGLLNYSDRF